MKKAEMALIWVTAAFICVLLGFFLGRNAALGVLLSGSNETISQITNPPTVPANKIVNINTASIEELQELPGIGAQIAKNIVTYRAINGPFQTVDDLLNVDLIGESRLELMRDYISLTD